MKKYVQLFIVLVVGFVGGVAGTWTVSNIGHLAGSTTSSGIRTESVSYNNTNSTTEAVKKVQNAVVSVINYGQNPNSDDLNSQDAISGEGSGVIYKKDKQYAYIVTNNHVVSGAASLDIQLADGSKVAGELVGADAYSDIAVIRIAASKAPAVAQFGDSSKVNVG